MAGAIAGSTILHYLDECDHLRVVTLTVNNRCNLDCPHCYLHYSREDEFVGAETLASIAQSGCQHVAIVGKEPLIDRATARSTGALVRQMKCAGKTVSTITNGHGLGFLDDETRALLAWIDVSFDGGPRTYGDYRRSSYSNVIRNVAGLNNARALHTLSRRNLGVLSDLMAVRDDHEWTGVLLSPYLSTSHDSRQSVGQPSLDDLTNALTGCAEFMRAPEAFVVFDSEYFQQQHIDPDRAKAFLKSEGLLTKAIWSVADPFDMGYLRVTYDGLVLRPLDSLFPSEYGRTARPIVSGQSLDSQYLALRFRRCA